MNRLVFSNNIWKTVKIPNGCDPSWIEADFLYYASCWVLAESKGFSEKRSEQLAEALVSKRLYPELIYDKVLEKDLKSLWHTE